MSTDLNLFEAYAEAVKPRHERRRAHSLAKRKRSLAAKRDKMLEQQQLVERQYRLLTAEEHQALLDGDYGHEIQQLIDFLDRMSMRDGAQLVAFIQHCIWLVPAPDEIRHQALHLIGRACTRLRERAGLPPYDDRLPWETPGVFIRIRELIGGTR